jgi:hypothetical protein
MATIVIGAQWGDEVCPIFTLLSEHVPFSQPRLHDPEPESFFLKINRQFDNADCNPPGERQARRYSLPYREALRQGPRREQCRTHYSREWGYIRFPPSAFWIDQSRMPECDWVWSCGGLFSPVLKGLQVAWEVLLREIMSERHNGPELFVVTQEPKLIRMGLGSCPFLFQGVKRSGS